MVHPHFSVVVRFCICELSQYFVNSTLSLVLLFRRRLKSVADVLKVSGIRGLLSLGGMLYWGIGRAVCRHGPCGPISSLHPWDNWIYMVSVNGFLIPLGC